LEVVEAAEPGLRRDDEVLLRVDVVGICGSDVHTYSYGQIGGAKATFPWILGHECAATVLEVGSAAGGIKVGQRVAVDPLIPCNRCDQCLAGRKHTCRNQKFLASPGQAPGALVERLVMPEECCHPIPDSVTAVQAALVEPLAIGLHARNLAGLRGGSAAILGSGPIGLCVLLALKNAGATRVFVTDLIDARLELARRLGADATHRGDRGDVLAQAARMAPEGMDCVFECAGKPETIDQGIAMLKPAGRLLLVGIPDDERIAFDIHLARRRELVLQNVRRQNRCLQPAIELVAEGKVDVRPLATHHFELTQAQEAFETVAEYRDGVVKAMIHVTKLH
jgi:L-iditol 2-dehydrogenase